MTRHVILAVTFPPRSNDGPATCVCLWSGMASGFSEHRRSLGLASGVSKPLADDPRPDWVRRSALRGAKAAAKGGVMSFFVEATSRKEGC